MITFNQYPQGNLKIWKFPERNKSYLLPADVSEGLEGGNFSCCHVIDRQTFEQVAVWHGLEEPYKFGEIIFNLGMFYNGGLLAPERNNNGISTIDYLRVNDYPNIYRMQTTDSDTVEETHRLGWATKAYTTRPLMLDSLKQAIRTQAIKINDSETLAELKTFIRNPKTLKTEAASGNFDDRVMSMAIGCYLQQTIPIDYIYEDSYDESNMDKMKARWGQSSYSHSGGYK